MCLVILAATGCGSLQKTTRGSAERPLKGREDRTGSASEERPAPAPEEPGKPDEPQGPDLQHLAPEELLRHGLSSIPDEYHPLSFRGQPAVVRGDLGGAGFTRVIGLASDDEQLAVWYWPRSRTDSTGSAGIERIGRPARIDSFDSVWLDPDKRTVGGFVARLIQEGTEEQLVVIDSRDRPYVVRSVRTPNSYVELTDVDRDSIHELVEYARVFEPQGNQEVYMHRYEWDGAGFALASSTPLLREVNRFLEQARTGLETGTPPFPLTWLEPDGDEDVPARLPVKGARLPAMRELPVELGAHPWRLAYRLALEYENGVSIYSVGLAVNPGARELVAFAPP